MKDKRNMWVRFMAMVLAVSISCPWIQGETASASETVSPQIPLDESNVTVTEALGKFYDGSDSAVVTAQLNNQNQKIDLEQFETGNLTVSFEAHYWNKEGYESGDARTNTQVQQIVLSELKVLEGTEESKNYYFPEDTRIFIDGPFEIAANEPFLQFTDLEFPGVLVEQSEEKEGIIAVHWLKEDTELKKDHFYFGKEPAADLWEECITITANELTWIYAKNSEGKVSQPICMAVDKEAPTGEIYAKAGEEHAVSITQLIDEYYLLSKENEIFITFTGMDAHSKISKIEWYGSDTAWNCHANGLTEKWEKLPAEEIHTIWVNEGPEKCVNVSGLLLERIDKKEELKRFYYARVTDFAGNVSYQSSAGVLQDCSMPVAELKMPSAETVVGAEKQKVYSKVPEISVEIKEEGISSGIAGMKVELFGKNGKLLYSYPVGAYENGKNFQEDIWSADSKCRIDAMKALWETEHPTDAQIKASNEGALKTQFYDLEDGYYTVTVQVIDKAGNKSEIVSESFIKDSKAPEITIGNAGERPSGNLDEILEFHRERTEKNIYTGGDLTIFVSDMTKIEDLRLTVNGREIEAQCWKLSEDGETGRQQGTITLEFGEGKRFPEGRYQVAVFAADALNRETEQVIKEFVIDHTAPAYTVQFSEVDEFSYKGDKGKRYYKDSIEAKFQVLEETAYEDALLVFVVKNADGEEVFRWKKDDMIIPENFIFEHEKGSKEFLLVIPAIEENNDDGYTFMIEGRDQAGNVLQAVKEEEGEHSPDYKKEMDTIRAMDVTAPVLKKVDYDTKEKFKTVQKKDYVNAETTLTFTIEEHHPANNKSFVSGDYEEKENQWTAKKGEKDLYTTKIFVPMKGALGEEQTVTLEIIDKAGNRAKAEQDEDGNAIIYRSRDNTTLVHGKFVDRFTVDTVAPGIKLEYIDHNPAPNRKNVDGVDYFNHPITVKVTVNEHNFDESFMNAQIKLINQDAEPVESKWETDGENHVKFFRYEADNQYTLILKGTDNAGNPPGFLEQDEKMSAGIKDGSVSLKVAVDRKIPKYGDTGKPAVMITPKEEAGTTIDGQKLYTTDVIYEVTVYDPLNPTKNGYASGIDHLELTVKGEDGTFSVGSIDKEGKISCKNGIRVKQIRGNTATLGKGVSEKYVYQVTIPKKVFNTNKITLNVRAEDVAANVNEQTAEAIAVDTTPPRVNVSFEEGEVSNETYFHETRTAAITVTERNFDAACLQFFVNGKEQTLDFKPAADGDGNHDNRKWMASYTFTEENDYELEVICKDLAGNQGDVHYEGQAPKAFTTDWTKPKIDIAFDNNHPFQENYYDAKRVAAITIIERNFDQRDVKILGKAFDAGTFLTYPVISEWSSSGDVHTAFIAFEADAIYTLDVEYTDLARNEAEQFHETEFIIDTKNPEIIISGVENGQAYTKEVLPIIEFADNHYEKYEVKLTRTEKENIRSDVTEQIIGEIPVSIDETGRGVGNKQVKNLEHLGENDGIYTLTVSVYDKAGRFSEEQVVYSVNRFGTVYVYSEDLIELIEGYHQNIAGELYIKAYNANPLVEDAVKLEISCDGSVIQNQRSKANVTKAENEGGWSVYQFDLDHADFKMDGRYRISISDRDEAGNTKTNGDDPIEFYKDATKPVIDNVIGLETKRIRANEWKVEYSVSDAIGLELVQVYVNDVLADQIEQFEYGTVAKSAFRIGAGMNQNIRFVIKDRAGNVLDTAKDEFDPAFDFYPEITISSSRFVLWYSDKPLFWSTIAAVVMICGTAVVWGVKKRKR